MRLEIDNLSDRLAAKLSETNEAVQEVDTRVHRVASEITEAAKDIDRRLHVVGEQVAEVSDRVDQAVSRSMQLASEVTGISEEMAAVPYMADPLLLMTIDTEGREVIGYRAASQGDGGAAGGLYLGFEDIFRGSEEFIRERQRAYVRLLVGRGPIVDVGCGRGELLDVLKNEGAEAVGIDMDPGMVARCRQKGHQVYCREATDYLAEQVDDSLGAIFCAQVIEHMPFETLLGFLRLARRKLAPGGILIAETVNPHSFRAMKTFWVDLTHQRPIFPEVLVALCRLEGFAEAAVVFPNGTGELERDRRNQGEYALIASNDEGLVWMDALPSRLGELTQETEMQQGVDRAGWADAAASAVEVGHHVNSQEGANGVLIRSDYALLRPSAESILKALTCMRVKRVSVDIASLWLPAYDDVMLRWMEHYGTWEPEEAAFVRSYLRPGMSVLDIGANVGYHTILFAQCVGATGRVVALEPEARNFSLLCANLHDYVGQVDLLNAAAADATSTLQLSLSSNNCGDHRLADDRAAADLVDVAAVRIDDVLSPDAFIQLVKIDVQGAEHLVVRGMEALIARAKPTIMVEFWPQGIEQRGDSPLDVLAYYRSLGLSLSSIGGTTTAPADDPTFIRRVRTTESGFIMLVATPDPPLPAPGPSSSQTRPS